MVLDEARRRRLIARLRRTVQEWADDEAEAACGSTVEAKVWVAGDGAIEFLIPTDAAHLLDEDDGSWEKATIEVFT